MKRNQKVSVVIHTKDRPSYINNLLHQLQSQTRTSNEVIIVENIDSNKFLDPEKLQNFLKKSVCKYFSVKNKNIAQSRNISLLNCTGKIIVSIDDDVVIYDSLLEDIVKSFDSDSDIDGIFPQVLPIYQDRYSYIASVFLNHHLLNKQKKTRVKTFSGCIFALRRKIISINSVIFDSNLNTGEDIQFFADFSRAGAKFYYFPTIKVKHYFTNTLFSFIRKHVSYGKDLATIDFFVSEIHYIDQYLPSRKMHIFFPFYFFLERIISTTKHIKKANKLTSEFYFQILLHELCYWLGIYTSRSGINLLRGKFLLIIRR